VAKLSFHYSEDKCFHNMKRMEYKYRSNTDIPSNIIKTK